MKNTPAKLTKCKFSEFRLIIKEHKSLLIFNTPSELLNNIINQLPIVILQKLAGPSYVGNFAFVQRFLGIPQQVLSSSVGDVFRQKASKEFNESGNCRKLFKKTFYTLLSLALIPFLVSTYFAPQIFSFLFGENWQLAGVFCQILSPLYFFRFIISPLTYTFFLSNRLKEDFVVHLLFLFLIVVSFYSTSLFFENKIYLIWSYSISYSIVYIIYFYRSFLFSNGNYIINKL